MTRTLILIIALAAVLYVSCAEAAPPAGEKPPETLERVTGSRVLSYCIFAVLAFLAVLLIFRGIRAR